jgi:hypothetical protein
LLAGCDPADAVRRGMVHLRSNCGALGDSLGYSIVAGGRFRWTGKCDLSAGSFLATPRDAEDLQGIEAAMDLLRRLLAEGTREAKFVLEQAYQDGISERTLRRAKARLGVVSEHYGTENCPYWQWSLPENKGPGDNGASQGETKRG